MPQTLTYIPSEASLVGMTDHFGMAEFEYCSVNQWLQVWAPETEIGIAGGWGSGKSMGGIYRATRLSCYYPGNKGVIGGYASTDLAATTQSDALEFWKEANLLEDYVQRGKYKVPTAVLRCLDPETNNIIPNQFSEVLFLHLDDPDHLRSHKFGWGWIEEAHRCTQKARDTLMSRLRLNGFEDIYSLWETWNHNGHDRLYEYYFNPEGMQLLKKKKLKAWTSRRAINASTYENRFLPPSYIENMENSYSEKKQQIFLHGSFEEFEGQIHEEWDPMVNVIDLNDPEFTKQGKLPYGIPETWNRLLALDVGGTDPWAWLWGAVDPWGNLIIYDEINRPGTRVEPFATEATPKIGSLKFQSKVIDYENKVVAGELRDHGINFTNAKKQNKNDSIFRADGYIHANPKHSFPEWHPRYGEKGAPRLFISRKCKHLIKQIPQARWRKKRGSDVLENELDPDSGPDDSYHAFLYMLRELPRPSELDTSILEYMRPELSQMSRMMHFQELIRKQEDEKRKWSMNMGAGWKPPAQTTFGIPNHLLEKVQ
jgi:hypothetical protein